MALDTSVRFEFAFFTNPITQLFFFIWGGGGRGICIELMVSSSPKHDTVPRVINLYCFYVKTSQNVLHYGMVKRVNRPPSIYQYSGMATRLYDQNSTAQFPFLCLTSLKGDFETK